MANKYKAGDYKNSGMSKSQYEAVHGKSSSASSSKSSKNTSLEKMGSFNPSYFGSSFEQAYNQADSGTKAAISVLGTTMIKQAQANEQIPVALTSKDIKDLWKKAENDKTIKEYYANELKIGTETLNKNIDLLSKDFQNLTKQQQQQYIDAKKQINETQAAAGTAYSGFRTQAQKKAEQEQASVVESAKSQLQSQLNSLESAYEQTFGSKALSKLKISPMTGYTGELVGGTYAGPQYGSSAYSPIGKLSGTQSTAKTQDIASQYQELAAEKLQQRGL